jgi:hypothetical protein
MYRARGWLMRVTTGVWRRGGRVTMNGEHGALFGPQWITAAFVTGDFEFLLLLFSYLRISLCCHAISVTHLRHLSFSKFGWSLRAGGWTNVMGGDDECHVWPRR